MRRDLLVGGDQWVAGKGHGAPRDVLRRAISYGVGVVVGLDRCLTCGKVFELLFATGDHLSYDGRAAWFGWSAW